MQSLIKFNTFQKILFSIFLVLHLFLLNVNYVEWGDSYRILRASNYISELSYPEDEKRPPLFSAVLAVRPEAVDPVVWGKLFMFGVSVLVFFAFKYYLDVALGTKKDMVLAKNAALAFLALNPVLFYWSLRIMADVFFVFLVLIAFIFFHQYQKSKKFYYLILTALLTGLSILTRFEGYIVLGALGLGFVFYNTKDFLSALKDNYLTGLIFGLSSLIVVLPYWLYRNPFTSSYFEEPEGRTYNLDTLVVYIVSFIFLFGVTGVIKYLIAGRASLIKFLKQNIHISAFLIVELLLILAWPAAIPRLFVVVVPFISLLLGLAISSYYASPSKHANISFAIVGVVLLILWPLVQFKYGLQFLVMDKYSFMFLFLISLVSLVYEYFKKFMYFFVLALISMFVWTISSVWLHKDIYKTLRLAADYSLDNISGKVWHNDVDSVIPWYLQYSGQFKDGTASYKSLSQKENTSYETLKDNGIDYLVLTNEANPNFEFSEEKRPYLVKEFEYIHMYNGKQFWTKVFKVKYAN